MNHAIIAELSKSLNMSAVVLSLDDVTNETVLPHSLIITAIELESPLLDTINHNQLEKARVLSENASILMWVTGGSLYIASSPDFSLILGPSRLLMLERPSLKMPVFDLNFTTFTAVSAKNVSLVQRSDQQYQGGRYRVPSTQGRGVPQPIYHRCCS